MAWVRVCPWQVAAPQRRGIDFRGEDMSGRRMSLRAHAEQIYAARTQVLEGFGCCAPFGC